MKEALQGALSPFHGFLMIARNGRARWLAFFPLGIYFVLFMFAAVWMIPQAFQWAESFRFFVSGWSFLSSFLEIVFQVFFLGAAWIAIFFGVFLIGRVFCSPFHSLLAESLVADLGLAPLPQISLAKKVFKFIQLFFVSLIESFVLAFVGLLVLVFSFIPGFHLVSTVLALLVVAYDSASFSYEAMGWGWKERRDFFLKHWSTYLGQGLSLSVLLPLPLLNILVFPVFVSSSAYLLAQILGKEGHEQPLA